MAKKSKSPKLSKKRQREKGQLSQKQLDKISGGAYPTAVNDQITD